MKTTSEKESVAAGNPRGGGWGGGRGGGGRSGGRSGGNDQRSARGGRGRAGGRGGGNHGRHPRTSSAKRPQERKNQGGRGRGRPRASSYTSDAPCTIRKTGPYAHLFCSDRHAFALSRVFYPHGNDAFLLPSQHTEESRNKHRIASDEQFEQWWECVKMIRCRVPLSDGLSSLERCPICLDDEMVSPFISPCGHSFCLPCVLGYLNSVATDLNEESDRIKKSKQQNVKGNSAVVGSTDAKDRATVTSVRARCPMCSSGSSMVLNAGDAMITYKDLRPVVLVPTLAVSPASIGEAKGRKGKKGDGPNSNLQSGTQMTFSKLHRIKDCPVPYLPLSGSRRRGINSAAHSEPQLPDLPDGDDDAEECNYARQYFVGVREYADTLQRDLNDLNSYRETTVHCQLDPREDWNVTLAVEAVQAAQRRWLGGGGEDTGFQGMEADAKVAALGEQMKQTLVLEQNSAKNPCANDNAKPPAKPKGSALLQPGSIYLQQKLDSSALGEEYLYYQSSDGQPCFLSGINVAMLMHEFALHAPEPAEEGATVSEGDVGRTDTERTQQSDPPSNKEPAASRKLHPLPDELTGTVVEVEELAVTPSLIRRKPFLSHLPLTTLLCFVEVDMNSGGDRDNKPRLSQSTMSKFRGELQRRKAERLRAAKQEQKADKAAKAKSEKAEQRRRRELLGANYLERWESQEINPDDKFFQIPAASFDETDEMAQRSRSGSFQFSQVCAEGGAWPELSSLPGGGMAAPSSPTQSSPGVTSSAPLATASSSWGSRLQKGPPATNAKPAGSEFPSLSESSLPMQKQQSKSSTNSPWGSR